MSDMLNINGTETGRVSSETSNLANTPKRIDWDTYFMSLAHLTAQRSSDPNTKLGAVIVGQDNVILATGYNGFPRGMDHPEADSPIWERPTKYAYMAHAEENAIVNAGRSGVSLVGAKLYVPWLPCNTCARLIISAGIKEVIVHTQSVEGYSLSMSNQNAWIEANRQAVDMFERANVNVRYWDSKLGMTAYYGNKDVDV